MDRSTLPQLPITKKQLSGVSSGGGQQHWKRNIWSYLAVIFPVSIPAFHMLLFGYLWEQEDVERKTCTCNCWDNVFKGPYEHGVARYKHVYFNATSNTFKIWTVTMLFFIGMYEVFKKIIGLFVQRKLRLSMALLFFISFHSHYYAWWAMFNYWNDEFNAQWNHQLFFTVTELLSTVVVVIYLDRRITVQPLPLLIVINIALAHILCGSWDNFVENVLLQKGGLHQILRDIALMSTDIFYTSICFFELRIYAKANGVPLRNVLLQKNHLTVVGWFTALMNCVTESHMKASRASRDSQTKSDAAFQRYLYYCNHYMNHTQRLKSEKKLYASVQNNMEEMQKHNVMPWIELQFLKKAADVLCQCRHTLMHTYLFVLNLGKANPSDISVIFEAKQRDLEIATQKLSEYLELDISSEDFAKQNLQTFKQTTVKHEVQDMCRNCERIKQVLLDHANE